jgi:hypothetical protein
MDDWATGRNDPDIAIVAPQPAGGQTAWTCGRCTFHNQTSDDCEACEMCNAPPDAKQRSLGDSAPIKSTTGFIEVKFVEALKCERGLHLVLYGGGSDFRESESLLHYCQRDNTNSEVNAEQVSDVIAQVKASLEIHFQGAEDALVGTLPSFESIKWEACVWDFAFHVSSKVHRGGDGVGSGGSGGGSSDGGDVGNGGSGGSDVIGSKIRFVKALKCQGCGAVCNGNDAFQVHCMEVQVRSQLLSVHLLAQIYY